MRHFILTLILLTSIEAGAACRFIVTAGMHEDGSDDRWVGESSMGTMLSIDCVKPLTDNVDLYGGWVHLSHLMRGNPVNSREESHVDHLGVGIVVNF